MQTHDQWALLSIKDEDGSFGGFVSAKPGEYQNVLLKVGKSFGFRSDETVPHRIRGPATILGSTVSHESARSGDDRGHIRVLIQRGAEFFVAGCKYSLWTNEHSEHYVKGPLTLSDVQFSKPDIALLNACNLAPVIDL